MLERKYVQNAMVGLTAALFGGTQLVPGTNQNGPVLQAAVSFVSSKADTSAGSPETTTTPVSGVAASVRTALSAFATTVRPLSHSRALEDAFGSYFAFKAAHPNEVRKPYLYFVDYGLPSTTPRGYVFDMSSLRIVDGPFTVAHGRGSSASKYGVPTRFSNAPGAATTSLGLYVAQETYDFHGHAGGRAYSSLGLRLMGVSGDFNDKARARGVVAHGAPYVTPTGSGRSEGCPAMEQARARRLLPELANGGLVFLFAPEDSWMNKDPWILASSAAATSSSNIASIE
jgi:hypothetical protein